MRWRRYGGRVLAAFAAAVVCWALSVEREPRFGGKTLSQWMVRRQQALTVADIEEADNAMRKIGRRGLPWMIRWLRGSEPRPWKARLYAVTEKLPTKWVPFKFSAPPSSQQEWHRAETAAAMIGALGPGATNALPELLRMLSDTRAKAAAGRAFTAITSLGRDALPCLLAGSAFGCKSFEPCGARSHCGQHERRFASCGSGVAELFAGKPGGTGDRGKQGFGRLATRAGDGCAGAEPRARSYGSQGSGGLRRGAGQVWRLGAVRRAGIGHGTKRC